MARKRAVGRPSSYCKSVADAICWQIMQGQGLAQICKGEGMPSTKTIYAWIERFPDFHHAYSHARAIQAHTMADEVVGIADDVATRARQNVPPCPKCGHSADLRAVSHEEIGAVRAQIDARKWRAEKLLPRVYGTKVLHSDHTGEGPPSVKLSYDYSLLSVDELLTLKALLQKATPRQEGDEPAQIEGDLYEDDDC